MLPLGQRPPLFAFAPIPERLGQFYSALTKLKAVQTDAVGSLTVHKATQLRSLPILNEFSYLKTDTNISLFQCRVSGTIVVLHLVPWWSVTLPRAVAMRAPGGESRSCEDASRSNRHAGRRPS